MENYQGILFCNTNLPENFDKATDRRFNFCVEFKSLTKEGIDILCESYFKDYCLTEKQKEDIFKSGEITPGDFGKLHKKMIFMAKEKINADLICQELITLGKEKKRSYENQNKIGFGI
jgi:AAA+ superfamily predicted ATPase